MENAGGGLLLVAWFISKRFALRGGPLCVGGVESECGVEDLLEGLAEFGFGVDLSEVVGVDAYDVEEDLVELPLDVVWGGLVELVAVLGQRERADSLPRV